MSSNNGEVIASQLASVLSAAPGVPAVLHRDVWSSWGGLAHAADAVGAMVTDHGLAAGAPVAIVLHNRPSSVAALLGLLIVRRPPVLISPVQPSAAIASAVETAGTAAVVAGPAEWTGELTEVATRCGMLGISLPDGALDDRRVWGEFGVVAPGLPGAVDSTELDASTALVVPTSGTTGPPKPIPIRWDQLPIRADEGSPVPVDPSVRPPVIQALSMATITGVMGVLRAIGRGRSLALLERVDVAEWAALVERFQLRRAGLPPAAMRSMLDTGVPREHLASLDAWVTGSAPLAPELQVEFERTYGVPVLVAYGATEFGGAVAAWTLDLHERWHRTKLGSVGRAVDGVRLRVVDQSSGAEVAADTVGILEVQPANGDGAWMRTNDLARVDQDGFLYVIGRADDVVVRGGFKVPLGEVESMLGQHPSVHVVAAFGVPDPRLGEVPVAAVVLARGATATPEDLRKWMRQRIAPYKVPTRIDVVDALPMTASHKVDKARLRAQVLSAVREQSSED